MQTKPKSRFSRLVMATLAGTALIGGMGATLASAESGKDDAAALQALSTAKVTLADAIRMAESAGQGMVTGAEFMVSKDGTYFDVTTQNGTTEIDHRIDPMTGKILASTPNAEEKTGDTEANEAQDLAAIQGAKLPLLQVISSAEAQGAKVLSAEYASKDGALGIEMKAADATGVVSELMVDAATGAVIPGDNESGEAEGDQSGEQSEAEQSEG